MADLPAPPIPAEVDLQSFQYMPLEIARLRKSKAWLICKRRPELAFYLLNLWTASWHEVPAGSLEDDDDVLADRAMCPPNEWPNVRADLLRGWTKCSDGRWYHEVIVEKALEAWQSKLRHAYDRECGRLRKDASRRKQKNFEPPTFEEWNRVRMSQGSPVTSQGHPDDVSGSHTDFALKGEVRERRGKGEVRDLYTSDTSHSDVTVTSEGQGNEGKPPSDPTPVATQPAPGFLQRLQAGYPVGIYRQSEWILAEREASRRIDEGVPEVELLAGKDRYRAQCDARKGFRQEFVLSPAKFFARDPRTGLCPYQDPFPLPEPTEPRSTFTPAPTLEQIERDIAEGRRDESGSWIGPREAAV